MYKERGDPEKVLQLVRSPRLFGDVHGKYGQKYVQVKMLAAPVNPADINMIQGLYPIKPDLPAIGGNEGCGVVLDIGSDVTSFAVGDYVLPKISGWGTWRKYATAFEENFLKVPRDISPIHASMLSVNPCTAYRMLSDFAQLNPGDVILQNGGNSGVGQCVIQLAKQRGLQTINIVRDRPNINELVDHLKYLGADYVIVEENNGRSDLDMKHLTSHIPKAKLALNCIGGKASLKLLKYMDRKAVLVTYGGMSKRPLVIPAGPLIFKDIRLAGFWMTQWNKENLDSATYNEMWKDIFSMVEKGSLKIAKYRTVPLDHFDDAILKAMQPFTTEKQILVTDELLK